MQRPNRRMRRSMKKKGKGLPPNRGKPMTMKTPQTKKEILDKIRELEYQRIELPKYPSIHVVRRFDAITGAIKIYYQKLEILKKSKDKKNETSL